MDNMNDKDSYEYNREVYEQKIEPKKNMFLYVSSILMIIVAVLGSIVALTTIFSLGASYEIISAEINIDPIAGRVAAGIVIGVLMIAIVANLVQIYVGYLGIKTAKDNDPKRAKKCFIIGIILLIISLLGFLADKASDISSILGLLVLAAYIYGAKKVKDQEEELAY